MAAKRVLVCMEGRVKGADQQNADYVT
jgi:hypothetical protein